MNRLRKGQFRAYAGIGWAVAGILGFGLPLTGYSDDFYTVVVKRQDVKEKSRWSLADWLDTRDKMRMQDVWLALHSSPNEFFLGGNYQFNQVVSGASFQGWEGYFGAFASIFGLEGKYESGLINQWHAFLDFRVFGFHDQATSITLQVGLRNQYERDTTFRSAVAGLRFNLYLARFFGISGLYHHSFPSTPNPDGLAIVGERFQTGLFLDIKFVRIYGDYVWSIETVRNTQGARAGIQLYF